MSIGYVTKPFPSNEYNFLARDGAIGPVDQCSAPTEEDFRSSETSNGISQIPFEPDRALFAQKRVIHRMPLFAQNKSARRFTTSGGRRLWTDRSEAENSNSILRMLFKPVGLIICKKGYPSGYPFAYNKSARRDSNPRPRPWQGRAPPTEPLAHFLCCRSPQRQVILYMIYLHLSITFFEKFWGTFLFLKCASNRYSC